MSCLNFQYLNNTQNCFSAAVAPSSCPFNYARTLHVAGFIGTCFYIGCHGFLRIKMDFGKRIFVGALLVAQKSNFPSYYLLL